MYASWIRHEWFILTYLPPCEASGDSKLFLSNKKFRLLKNVKRNGFEPNFPLKADDNGNDNNDNDDDDNDLANSIYEYLMFR